MTRIVSPQEFVPSFDLVVRRREGEIASFWEPWNAKGYTRLFLNPREGVLQEVAEILSLRYLTPYWTLDAVFCERLDTVHFPATWNMAESLSVAVEHENDPNTSHYEVNKLSIFNVPLKVIIAYPETPSKESALLSVYTEILRAADVFGDFNSLKRHVVIFAYKDVSITWRYFVYANRRFEPFGGAAT